MANPRSRDHRPRRAACVFTAPIVCLVAWLATCSVVGLGPAPSRAWAQEVPPGAAKADEPKTDEPKADEPKTDEPEAGDEKAETPTDGVEPLDAKAIGAKKEELEAAEEPDDATKQAIELYTTTLASLEQARQWRDEASAFERTKETAPAALEKLTQQMAETLETTPQVPEGASMEQMKQLRDDADASLTAARNRAQELEAEQTRRVGRRNDIPGLRQQTQSALEEVARQRAALPRPDDLPVVAEARVIALRAGREALEAQLAAFGAELESYDATRDLLSAQQQRWRNETDARDKLAKAWQGLVTERETAIARDEAEAARVAAAEAHPAVAPITQENLKLADLRGGPDGLVNRKTAARETLAGLRVELEPVEAKYDLARSWARFGALADFGARLRADRRALPDLPRHERGIKERRSDLSGLQFEQMEYRFELNNLPTDLDAKTHALAQLEADLDPELRATISAELDTQLADRRTRYETIISDRKELLDLLLESQRTEQRLVHVTEAYRTFIDQRIIWIRSAQPVNGPILATAAEQFGELLAPAGGLELARVAVRDAVSRPGSYLLAALIFGGVLALRRRADALLHRLGEQVTLGADTLQTAFQALLITVVRAAWLPGLLWFVGGRLERLEEHSDVAELTGGGLARVAWVYFVIEVVRHLCRPGGVGALYLDWGELPREVVRRGLRWFMPIALPLAFVTTARAWGTGGAGEDELGRVAFVLFMLVLTIFAAQVMRPSAGLLTDLLTRRRGGWVDHFRYWWYLGIVSVPLVLAAMTIYGYYYTALRLESLMVDTVIVALAAVVADGLIARGLAQTRRRLLVEQARRRAAEAGDAEGAPPTGEMRLDVVKLDAQARKMVRTFVVLGWALATWLIWIDILPALGVLDRVQLLPQMRIVTEEDLAAPDLGSFLGTPTPTPTPTTAGDDPVATTTPPGSGTTAITGTAVGTTTPATTAAAGSATTDRIVTLADVVVALAILVLVVIMTANLPGIIQIAILQRMPLRPSSRYAIATIARYLVAILGAIIVCHHLGLTWSKVQWLVAALSVGLGFGLQEIVANFICGLIILFERPVRIGDTVTVGTVSGVITRIQIRATTIRDWDRKELIIPNKQFITGDVINWTLSDTMLRVTVPVSVVYGSDAEFVKRLLLEAAKATETVVEDPRPRALLLKFAESSMDFQLRVFIADADDVINVKDELHERIDRAFHEAGIRIALPQREVRVRRADRDEPEVSLDPESE